MARPRKMMASQSTTVAIAADFAIGENSGSGPSTSAAGPRERVKASAVVTPMASSPILSQKERLISSRTGSPRTSVAPVSASTTRPLRIHGAKRLMTAPNAWSMRTRPMTRSAIISSETKTIPMVMMWIDWTSGTIHEIDLMVTLGGVISSHWAKPNIDGQGSRVPLPPPGRRERTLDRSLGLLGRRRQLAVAERLVPFDGVAVLAGGRRRVHRALEQRRPAAIAGRFAAAQRMQADADDGLRRELVDRDPLARRLRRTAHLDGPDDRLPLVVADHVLPLLVHHREEDLQVIDVRVHADDHAGEDPGLRRVEDRERVMGQDWCHHSRGQRRGQHATCDPAHGPPTSC